MTTHKQLYVNLPVNDLARTVAFFEKLGYGFNPKFTNEHAAAMVINENTTVMLLVEKFFKGFTPRPIADAKQTTEVLVAVSHESREAVDAIVKAAIAAGGRTYSEPKDHGFMYQWGFEDLDGHIWEHGWMDMSKFPG